MKHLINNWRHRRNQCIAIVSDLTMIPCAWFAACWLFARLDCVKPGILFFLIAIQGGSFFSYKLYRGIWRFASIPDVFRILRAVVIGTLVFYLYIQIKHILLEKAVFLNYAMLLTFFLCGSRITFRWLRDYRHLFNECQRVLIVGAGSAGESIVRDLLRSSHKKYQAVAFVDDDIKLHGRDIHGVRVQGACDAIVNLVKKFRVQLILIAIPGANSTDMRRIVDYCEQAKIPFRTLPSFHDLADGRVNVNALREVLLEDLLGREQAELAWHQIRNAITDKVILVSGGGGSIGAELCRQIVLQAPKRLIIIENNEYNLYRVEQELRQRYPNLDLQCLLASVTDRIALQQIFMRYRPEYVFHTAAYKHVPMLEKQIRTAIFNNVIGTQVMVECANQYQVKKFVLISTDKAVNPANIMGATKRASEVFCQNMNFHSATKFITVRFGNVLDSAGSVIPLFREQLSQGGPLTVTHPEITRFFMTIPEASQLILQAASMGKGGEIYVLDMGEPIKIRYLAEQMIKLSGKTLGKDIEIHYTGLRPGEKLYEELFHAGEELLPTSHVKIRQAKVRRLDWIALSNIFAELEIACQQYDEAAMRALLDRLVPEYNDELANQTLPFGIKEKV